MSYNYDDEWYDDGYNYDDEWYDDDEPIEYSQTISEFLTRNGNTITVKMFVVNGYRYSGQDWGEAFFETGEFHYTIEDFPPSMQAALYQLGKRIPEGETRELDYCYVDALAERLERWL